MPLRRKLELLTFGDELLLGIRQNAHLTYLGELLGRHGLSLRRNQVVSDAPEDVARAFADAWESAEVVITTGGLGPTSDDNTREAVAKVLGRKLVFDERVEASIRERFRNMNREMTAIDRRQCYRPEGSEIIPNRYGTAPGIYYEADDGRVLFMLPGPTHELRPMMEGQVLPILCRAGLCCEEDAFIQLRSFGLGESMVNEALQPLFDEHPGLGVSYCVHEGVVDVRVSPGSVALSRTELEAIANEARELLGDNFVCYGQASLAQVVLDQVRSMEKTLALAESCTGGLLASAFTDLAGASKAFLGGVVCYKNDIKVQMLDVPESILLQHGAVSAETAVAMVMGVAERFDCDYALSVTGFAGPGGGTPENPVGTIYIGYYSPLGVWSRKLVYPGERLAVKARAVNAALDFMRRNLEANKVEDFLVDLPEAAEMRRHDIGQNRL